MSLPFDTHNRLLENLDQTLKEMIEVEDGNRRLEVVKLDLPDPDPDDDLEAQKGARVRGKSYTKPVKATVRLLENRKTVDEATVKILDLPQVTVRGTYVVGGNEYAFPLQKRLIPGVYTRRKDDGDISAWVNTGKGRNFKITLRDKHDDFVIEMGAKKINLLAALRGLGVRDEQLRQMWGTEVFNTNKKARGADKPAKALKKLYAELHYGDEDEIDTDDASAVKDWVLNYFDQKTELDSENVQLTMGQGSDKVSIPLILQISRKVLDVRRGDEDEDNRESLIHNDIYDLSDFAIERLTNRQYKYKIERTLKRNMGRFDKVSEIVSKKLFQDPLDSTFTKTSLARIPKQNNPMDMMANFTEITARGEGGIESIHAITNDARAVDPSHLNFIDPMHTPEGQNIGTTLHLARGVKKDGKTLKKEVWNVQSHKAVELTPREFYRAPVAFAEYYDREQEALVPDDDDKVKVTVRGNIKRMPPAQVKYAIKSTTDMFGANSLGVPFLSHNNGTRGMTAAKMQAQAKSLKHREAPKVQATLDEHTDETIEERMGAANTPKSPVDGTVSKVARDHIIVKDKKGKPHKVSLPKDFWLNDGNFQDSEPIVKKGDTVKKGQPIADSNYTRDGKLALGVNLKTAYTPYKGLNHEDGLVVSESGAEKLTSNHAHQKTVSVHDNEVLDKEKYQAYFPSLYTRQQLEKLDGDGVVKKGTELKKGDPLVVKMRGVEQDTLSKQLQNISQLLTRDFRDTSVNWDKPSVGTVAEVHHRADDILIVVKTEEKARVGDKLVGRYGNKGTITSIIPDDEMPQDEEGNAMQLLLNPNGVVSRMNMGQIMETTASNIANHDGDTYRAKPFSVDHTDQILKELKERGLKDHGSLYDPTEDRTIDGVLMGDHYTLKLEHKVDKKLSARGAGPEESYSLSGQPSSGGGKGGRAVGLGEMYALLAHGADANLSEMYTFKGDKSFEHWRAIENGTSLPPPEMPKSSRRFVSMLRGMGINLEEDDKQMTKMVPFLDKDVREISNGEIKEALALRGKDLKSEEGGLFDYDLTGGLEGDQWTHIELAEPMPHPTFEKSIKDVTGLKGKEFDAIMAGDKGVIKDTVVDADKPGAKTGGEAIRRLLNSIDPDKRLDEIKEKAKSVSGSRLNKLHREARVLKNFRDNDIDLDKMVVDTIPVIPPKFRPVVELPNGDLNVADVNEHYRSTLMMNNQLKMMKDRKGLKKQSEKVRKSLYDGMSGTMGMSMGLVDKPDVKGLAETIAGNEPKRGYYQRRLLKRRQEVSGTGVVSPNPELDMDQIGVPEEMAWKTFKPFIKKELRSQGLTPLKAEDEIKDRSKLAKDALLAAMEDRHVLANRAPTLHKFSFMAFKPKLVPGHAVQLPVEVLGGFNADFDGDTFGIHVVASDAANKEAENMLPSKNLYQSGRAREQMNPQLSHEYVLGLFKLTREGNRTGRRFPTPKAALDAAEEEEIDWNDVVRISGVGETTAGRVLAMQSVPEDLRDYNVRLDKRKIGEMLTTIDKEADTDAFKRVMEQWKHLGRKYAYTSGSSFLLSDLQTFKSDRSKWYAEADRQASQVKADPNIDEQTKKKKLVEIYGQVDDKVKAQSKQIGSNAAGKSNNIRDMVDAGARGNPDQVKQLVGALGLLLNHRQETMEEPVRGNYAEGLDSSEYFSHLYSQRKGMIDKSQGVAGPGYLSKELTNPATEYKVTMTDCRTNQGRQEKVDRHLLDRALAKPAAGLSSGAIIDTQALDQLKSAGVPQVTVRSVLTCEADTGICAKCFGLDEHGDLPQVGKNLGVSEVQALTERTTQLPMKSFHTGGVASAETGLSNAFDRASQIFHMPENITGKAILSTRSGTVTQIRDSGYGGKIVSVAGKDHKVPAKLDLKVEQGDSVKKGDPLSEGIVKPQELLGLRDINAVQTQLRDDLHETFSGAGVNLQKRNYEMTVKTLTDQVRVRDPGGCDEYVPGDYTTLSKVKGWNQRNPQKEQIKYTSVLPGAQQAPQKSDDWARRMGLSRIKQTLEEGAGQGFKSDRQGPAPFADLALGPGSQLVRPGEEAFGV